MKARHIALFVLLVALGLRLVSPSSSYFLLAAYALLGRAQAIQALFLSWLFTMLSQGIGAEVSGGGVGRYAVQLGAAGSTWLRSGILSGDARVSRPVVWTLALSAGVMIHSALFSPVLDVSLLKATAWTLATATVLSAWGSLRPGERNELARDLFVGLLLVLIVSLPLLVLPLGYLRNGSGFQGILNHPQAFGATMSFLGTWAAAGMLGKERPKWTSVLLASICLALVVLSEARTAGFSMLLGVALAAVIVPTLAGLRIREVLPGLRSRRIYIAAIVALAVGIVGSSFFTERAERYISKRSRKSDLVGVYDDSRGELVRAMWRNIERDPWTGIGFGLASDPEGMHVERDSFFGLPVGAPTEKGVMPIVVLEELGIFGFAAVTAWFCAFAYRIARGGVVPLSMFVTIFFFNFGEATFFSPGGIGLLSLVLFGWAATAKEGARGA